ncbi:MAG: hypothetical protein C0501_13555 [Isosphaera sp.]|nr:hypothetical protein [Isosphaera sp.]
MERVKIDAGLLERLKDLTRAVELVDDDGFVVAVVQPKVDPARLGPELSPEEIERRCQPGRKTYTTEEVLAMLRKLP